MMEVNKSGKMSRRREIQSPRFWLQNTLIMILIQLFLSGCSVGNKQAGLVLTPVTESATGVHYPGKFVWNDLLTDNVPAAKDFYGQLFGWTFETSGAYTVIKNNGRMIGGMVHVRGNSDVHSASRWLCTLSVSDVDKAVDLVRAEGGIVHEGPQELPNRGRGALISDPQGAQLLLLYSKDGDPEDEEPAFGAWLWHELWSNKSRDSLAFYQKLVGYDFEGDPADYLILTKDEQWRAGIRYLDNNDLEMRWVPVVRVRDTEKLANRAMQLGGKILVDPRPTQDGGSVALLSDPTDALLIIQSWTAPTGGQEK